MELRGVLRLDLASLGHSGELFERRRHLVGSLGDLLTHFRQTTYDIKYYTNDWWHRGLFASQLAIYAILAAVSGSFNIGWQISSDAMNPFIGDNTYLTGKAILENEILSMKKSLSGVNIILFVSRMLLFLQYLRGMSMTVVHWRVFGRRITDPFYSKSCGTAARASNSGHGGFTCLLLQYSLQGVFSLAVLSCSSRATAVSLLL